LFLRPSPLQEQFRLRAREAIRTNTFVPEVFVDQTGSRAIFPQSLLEVCEQGLMTDPAFLHTVWRSCPFLDGVRLLIVTFIEKKNEKGKQEVVKTERGQDAINPNSWILMSDPRVPRTAAHRDVILKLKCGHYTQLQCSNADAPPHPIDLVMDMAQDMRFPPPIETGHKLMLPLDGVDPQDPDLVKAQEKISV
jgi:hypothetical protein